MSGVRFTEPEQKTFALEALWRCTRLVSGRAGFESRLGLHSGRNGSSILPRGLIIYGRLAARTLPPIALLVQWKNRSPVRIRRWIVTIREHHAPVVECIHTSLRNWRRKDWEFKSPRGYQFARIVQRQRQRLQNPFSGCSNHPTCTNLCECGEAETRQGLNPMSFGFNSRHSHHAPFAKWEGIGFTHRQDSVRSTDGVPFQEAWAVTARVCRQHLSRHLSARRGGVIAGE